MLGSRTDLHISQGGSSPGTAIVTRLFFLTCVFSQGLWVLSSSSWTTTLHLIAQLLSKSCWRVKILSTWIGRQAEANSLNGLALAGLNINKWMLNFRTKSFSTMKHIFMLMALLIAKIAAFGVPNVIFEKQMHPQRGTIWCGFWAGGIIGPYVFENEAGQAVNVTGARYCDMITQFSLSKLDQIDVDDIWL
ncbi:hypothetical protein X975_05745, partial [Stegodyphus mimosarum]